MSHLLNVKTRIPFVRQPSSESLMEGGGAHNVAMQPLPSRPVSVASTSDGLRPMSLRSLAPLNTQDLEPPVRRGWRDAANGRTTGAVHWAQGAWQDLAASPHAVGVVLALGGLTIWCVTLTVYVARSRSDISALGNMPFCEDLGLVHKA